MTIHTLPAVATAMQYDPIRRVAFHMGLALVFLRFSMLHQLQTYMMGFNMRLLFVVGIPAILGIMAAGGIQRSLRGRPTHYWLLFALWLFPATLFSIWKGGSAAILYDFLRTSLPLLLILGGLTVTWQECTLVLKTIGCAAVINVATGQIFESRAEFGDRHGLEFGSVTDPNDLAAHLLLVLPFLLWAALQAKRTLWRLVAVGSLAYGVLLVLRTGSRGAMVGLVVAALCMFLLGGAGQRLIMMMLSPIALIVLLTAVPEKARWRLLAFAGASGAVSNEALESQRSRMYLLRQTVRYTLQFPLFGVGPGQFAFYEGTHNQILGTHGYWHNAHNTYTQISSECGVPGLLLFLAAIGSSFRLVIKTYRTAARDPAYADIATAARCTLVGMTGFCTAITFLSFGYLFYLPALGGLAICLWHTAQEEFHARKQVLRQAPYEVGARTGIARASGRRATAYNHYSAPKPLPSTITPGAPRT